MQVGQDLSLFHCESCVLESLDTAVVHRVQEFAEGIVTAGDGFGIGAASYQYGEPVLQWFGRATDIG